MSTTTIPDSCHLWTKDPLEWGDLEGFAEVERFVDESHLIRALKRCLECGQLYYYEMYEIVDFEKGADPIYRMFIPIADESNATALNEMGSIELLKITPRLQFDWTDTKSVNWIR